MRAIAPFLWFDDDLEEAIDLYGSVFPGKPPSTTRMPDGKVLAADFDLAGQPFKGLNGGPQFRHTEAFSIFVECEGQAEVDRYLDALTRTAARRACAAGSRTSSGCRGRSSRSSSWRWSLRDSPTRCSG